MEKAEHLNSSRFVNLVKSGGGSYVEGSYRFDTLSNGISIHGGTVTARCDFAAAASPNLMCRSYFCWKAL